MAIADVNALTADESAPPPAATPAAPAAPPPAVSTRAPARAASIFSPAVIRQLRDIERAFGGRDKVIAILACAPKSADLDYLLNLLTDAKRTEPIANLCVDAQIRPSELLQHLSAGNYHYARTLSVATLPDHLPQTVNDLLIASHDHERECDDCHGSGEIVTTEAGQVTATPCAPCKGQGRRTYPASPEARNKALELSGLTQKGGMTINTGMQAVIQTGSGGGAFERVQAAAALIIRDADEGYRPTGKSAEAAAAAVPARPVVDGTLVEAAGSTVDDAGGVQDP